MEKVLQITRKKRKGNAEFEFLVEDEIYNEICGQNEIYGICQSVKLDREYVEAIAKTYNPFHVINKIKKELRNYYTDDVTIRVTFSKDSYKVVVYYEEDMYEI